MNQGMTNQSPPLDDVLAREAIEHLLKVNRGAVIASATQMAKEAGWEGATQMKNAQLNQLKSVALRAYDIIEITRHIEYQAGRLEAWKQVKDLFINYLKDAHLDGGMLSMANSIVQRHPELAQHRDRVWLSLCRLFIGEVQRQFYIWHRDE